MIKFILPLCFALAAVSGDWQPQDNGYNQMRFPVLPPQPYPEPVQVSSHQSGLPVAMPRARPCRRRNFGTPGVSPDSGWAPAPVSQQLFESQLVQPQFKPQSLTEAPATDDKNEAENSHPHKSVEKNSNPTYFTENHNVDDSERNKDIQNPTESEKTDQNAEPHTHVEDVHYHHHHHHPGGDRVDQHEHSPDSHECEMHGNADKHENHDESEHDADVNGKAAPVDVHEEAVKLISKCVQDAKEDKSEEDIQGASRRSNPSSSSNSKNSAVISPKSKPVDSDRDSKSNVNNVQSSSVLDRLDPQVYNPAKDAGKLQGNAKVSLLQNGRVCYACSTYFDSSCWRPNATTTVKYCLKNNNACITKTFKVAGKTILTRDCGNTCNQDDPYGMGPKHISCSMCHTDMCNSAYAIHGLHVLIVTFLITVVKFTLQ